MKTLLSLGDSIAFGYRADLERFIAHQYTLCTKEGTEEAAKDLNIPVGANCGDSRMMLAYLQEEWKNDRLHYDVIAFNCALHDIKTLDGKQQIDAAEYVENMRKINNILLQTGAKLYFVNTSKVVDAVHNSPERIRINCGVTRHDADVRRYNVLAEEVMVANGIPVIDLYTFTQNLGAEAFRDHVHYHHPYETLQAAFIAGRILA